MKLPLLEKLLTAILMGAVLVVAANAWFAFQAEGVLASTEYWVAHTWEVIAELERLSGLVKDAESGTRAYLITGQPMYLETQTKARALTQAQLDHLASLVSDNPDQLHPLAELRASTERRLARLDRAIELRRTLGEQAAFKDVLDGSGFAEMKHLRAMTEQMQSAERKLLERRQTRSARARTEARAAILFASALDFLFILTALWSLSYERKLRLSASENARRLEKLQAISDAGLTQLTVADMTTQMLERLRRVAEIDAVALCRWYGAEVEITAVNGIDLTPGTRLPTSPQNPLFESASSRKMIRLQGDAVSRLALPGLDPELASVIILPLSAGSGRTGLIVAARRGASSFIAQDEQLLSVVADRIGLAIDRAALFDLEYAARREAEAATDEVKLLNARLEERVRDRTAELEATNRELEAFSYSVSHDLRAPLRSVDGFSVALEEDFAELLTAEGKHYLARIRFGVQRMGQLIDALLQLSRITRAELVVEPVNLSEMAGEVARELEQQNLTRDLRFEIQPGLRASGDPRLLRAVFENMLGNAVKFTANVAPAVIQFGYSPERAAYYIQDNGAGFDQQYAAKLFVAFQRLHGEKDFKGSGIGLATVARVIRRHQGTMNAEGAVGGGATFWFTLGRDKL